MKLLRRLTPHKLLRYFNRWHKTHLKFNLIKIFTKDGYDYLRFPKEVNMPLERFALSMSLLERLSSGLSGSEMESILTEMEKALGAGLSNPKNAAVVANYINIIRERQNTVIHKDLLLNIAATWVIREDEDPYIINADIHKEKLNTFESMCREGSHDFFTRLHIEPLTPLMSMSPEDFQKLWEYNTVAQKKLTIQLQHLNTHLESGPRKLKKELKNN